ncbi:MAG: hypothetical protein LH614_08880, partial [Pyrinomonadaceae bacterium]|nr:hypothetical protein [Pyrinomonadaceae bacterium]
MKTEQNNLAERFLLGKLTEAETIKIEEEYFGKNDHFENILIAENDLIDAYIKGGLSAEDKRLFENRLLLNSRQRQRVQFAETLVKYASGLPAAEDLNSAPAKSNWLSIFAQFFSAKPMLSYSFAVAVFIFFAGTIWLAVNNNSPQFPHNNELAGAPSTAETEIQKPASDAQFENQEPTNETITESGTVKDKLSVAERSLKANPNQSVPKSRTEKPKKSAAAIFSTIILPLGLTRDGGMSKAFEIPAKANFVNLQLKFEEGDFASYFAVLETAEGRQIWSGKITKPAKNKNEKAVTATVPAHFLQKADYIITLKGLTKNGAYESV